MPFRFLLATIAAAAGLTAETVAVKSIRAWTLESATRVVIETSAPFEYKHGRLTNPHRAYFDLANSTLEAAGGKRYSTTAVNDALLTRVRAAETQPGATRVVFDLASESATYTVERLENPSRLVVELRSSPPAAKIVAAKTVSLAPKITIEQMRQEARQAVETGRIATPPAIPASVPAKVETRAVADAPLTTATIPVPQTQTPALPARRAARSLTRTLGLKLGRVVLDPGHGGHDYGTSSANGLHEKDLVLDVAKRLGALIEERLGSEVLYTRDSDRFVSLDRRTEFANERRADLFLSIHANSSPYKAAAGPETFFLNFTTQRDALDLASRENASSGKTIFELRDLLQKIALNDKLTESREFAARVQTSLIAAARAGGNARDRGVKRAPFVVLIGAQMPSVLTEIGFLSNAREEAQLRRAEYRQKLAEALYKGIAQYAGTLSRFQVARQSSGAATPE